MKPIAWAWIYSVGLAAWTFGLIFFIDWYEKPLKAADTDLPSREKEHLSYFTNVQVAHERELDPNLTISDSKNWWVLMKPNKSFFYVLDKTGTNHWFRLQSVNAHKGFFYPPESWLEVHREPVVSGPSNGVWTITFKD